MSETAIDYGSRTMPHDDVAEQSVLGGMRLISISRRTRRFMRRFFLFTVTVALRMRLRLLMS